MVPLLVLWVLQGVFGSVRLRSVLFTRLQQLPPPRASFIPDKSCARGLTCPAGDPPRGGYHGDGELSAQSGSERSNRQSSPLIKTRTFFSEPNMEEERVQSEPAAAERTGSSTPKVLIPNCSGFGSGLKQTFMKFHLQVWTGPSSRWFCRSKLEVLLVCFSVPLDAVLVLVRTSFNLLTVLILMDQ